MNVSFSSNRSDAIRAGLIAHTRPRVRRGRAWRAIGLVVAGALAGGGVSLAAFAATSTRSVIAQPSGQPSPSLGAAVAAPAGVTPGAPIISLLGTPTTQVVNEKTTIALKPRPESATHARVTVTPTTPGSLSFGTDPAGNNPSGSWSVGHVTKDGRAATWYDFPLVDSIDTLYLNPAGGFTGTVTIQYVNHVPTRLGMNAHGLTFGVTGSDQGEPDLIAVAATNGKSGYVNAKDLADADGTTAQKSFTSPADALQWQDANTGRTHTIAVYESDGTTVIGDFQTG